MPSKVHVLGGDLALHKRTLAPIKSLVYGLRRYDVDRCKALLGSVDPHADVDIGRGYMSHQAKVYLVSAHTFQITRNWCTEGQGITG